MATATKKMTKSKSTKEENTKVEDKDTSVNVDTQDSEKSAKDKELEELRKKIDELQSQLSKTETVPCVTNTEINADTEITVISQCVGSLSLSTGGYGKGMVYEFPYFGYVQDIPFSDLKDIRRNNQSFAEEGVFYVANEDAVEKLRLKQFYKRSIKHEDMQNLFSKDVKTIVELYKLAPEKQKENIIAMVIDKMEKGEEVDISIRHELSEISGKDLMSLGREK